MCQERLFVPVLEYGEKFTKCLIDVGPVKLVNYQIVRSSSFADGVLTKFSCFRNVSVLEVITTGIIRGDSTDNIKIGPLGISCNYSEIGRLAPIRLINFST